MAIQDSFNLSNAINSQSYAYKCWYNYNYGNNTMGISAKDMGEITQTWNNELKNWHATAMDDENAYVIEDDDFSMSKKKGEKQAKDKTGYDGKQAGQVVRTTVDTAAGVAGALGTTIGKGVANKVAGTVVKSVAGKAAGAAAKELTEEAAKKLAEGVVKEGATEAAKTAATAAATEAGKQAAEAGVAGFVGKAAEKAAAKAAAKAAEKGGEKAAEAGAQAAEKVTKAGKNIGWIITAPIALATGTAYTVKKPNKDEKEACDALQDEMMNAQSALYSAQEDMSAAGEEVQALSDEAQMANEDANEEIEEQKSEYDMYKASYDALMEKVEAGETLTDDEKELLKELVPLMQELGVGIQETQEDTTDVTGDIYDEMGTYQDVYDNSAETVAEVQGLTDYAESFDSSTRTMCYVEAGAQTLNAASGSKAAYQAGSFAASGGIFTAWAWGFAAMGAAGAVQSGIGTAQQMQWAGDVGTEINMRKDAQDINSLTSDIYDESIEGFDGNMSIVEDLELEIPKDLEDMQEFSEEAAENPALGGNTTDNTKTGGINIGGVPQQDPKDKEEV